MSRERFWVRFISKWTNDYKICSFDTEKEARWFISQVGGEILPWGGGMKCCSNNSNR